MKQFFLCIALLVCISDRLSAAGFDGDWFILDGNGGCWTNDITHPAARRLIERGQKGRPLNCVAITPNDEWIALVGGNEFYNSDKLPVSRKLAELWKKSDVKEYKCVAFTPQGGWVALIDTNTYFASQIPADAEKKLAELAKAGTKIRSIAFPPTGGWVILEGEHGVVYSGIPKNAAKKLDELADEKTRILCVAFDSHEDWIILTANNGVWTSNVHMPAVKMLHKLQRLQVPLKWVAFSPGEYSGEYTIIRQPVSRIKAELTTTIAVLGGNVTDWYVYGPVASKLPGQENMKTTLDPKSKLIKELSPLKRPVLFTHITRAPNEISPVLNIEGTLYSRQLCPRPAGGVAAPALSPEEIKNYTRASKHVDFESKLFQKWLDDNRLRRGKNERDIAFARRTYHFIRHNFLYEFPAADVHATAVAARGVSDCGGLSCLMVAILRANGIPARMLLGRWARSDTPPDWITGNVPGQWHVKAEFFAKSVGWVPLDMASAVTDRGRGEFAHFGNDPGNFITMFVGEDAEVETFVNGRTTNIGFQGVWWWMKGSGQPMIKEVWNVTTQPANKP